MSKKIVLLAVLIVALFAFAIVPHMARAATFTVLNGGDSGAGSLRQAVIDANAAAGADSITFDPAVTTVTLSSAISITDGLTITGPVTISGGGATRVFVIGAGVNVSISGVTITGGSSGGDGGAIDNRGTLSISNSILSGNTSTGASSGAIINWGTGTLIVTSSTFTGNTAPGAQGGAIGNSGGTVSVTSTLFTNNVGGAGGDDIYVWSGSLNVGGSCINGNAGASTDVQANGGSGSAENNWWGTALGPNQGVGSTDITVTAFLTSAPACGPTGGGGGGGSGGAGVPPDDRINWQHGDGYAIFYARYDEHAEPVLHTYCVSAEGKGTLELIITQDMLDKYPEFPDKSPQNKELFHSSVCRTPFFFYILTTGEYQINVGPDWEGKTEVIIFTGMPPGHVYFYSYDVFHPIDW